MHALIKWFHHLFNPHCEECMEERRCKSCDSLQRQLEVALTEKRMLLDAIVRKESPVEVPSQTAPMLPIMPKSIPWKVKQQTLEAESRQAAVLLKKKMDELNPDSKLHVRAPAVGNISTEDLEKELDLVEREREGENVREHS